MTVTYVDLADYGAIAAEVTGLEPFMILRVANLDLADSALHAPAAGFGDTEFYADFVDKASVLIVRLARNHPLPDGHKRAAWIAMRFFIEINHWTWVERPSVDDAERAVAAIASGERAATSRRPSPIGPTTTGSSCVGLERDPAALVDRLISPSRDPRLVVGACSARRSGRPSALPTDLRC